MPPDLKMFSKNKSATLKSVLVRSKTANQRSSFCRANLFRLRKSTWKNSGKASGACAKALRRRREEQRLFWQTEKCFHGMAHVYSMRLHIFESYLNRFNPRVNF